VIPGSVTIGFVHPGHRRECFAASLQDLILYDMAGAQRTAHPFGQLAKECGSGGIVDGRNRICRAVVDESESEWLLMVDSDAGFEHDTLERLIAAADPETRPVVGALSFGATSDGKAPMFGQRYRAYPTLMIYYDLSDKVGFAPMSAYPVDQLVEVSGTGCHCILIHRSALEKIRGRFAGQFAAGQEWYTPITHPKGPTTFSEDLSFCVRAAAADIPIHVHTGIKTTHDKGFAFLDEEWWIGQEVAAGRMVPRV
jgi:hypothetical protein